MLTPIERHGNFLVKRDDLWDECGVAHGGKARTAGLICRYVLSKGGIAIAVALDRNSSVPGMLSRVCKFNKLKLYVHIPRASSDLSPVFQEASSNGAEFFEHYPGYMSVRRKRLRNHAELNPGTYELGLGLSLNSIGVKETAEQVYNIPDDIRRVIVPVGSGGMLKGIVSGLGKGDCPPKVIGVCAGNPPDVELPAWVSLVQAQTAFSREVIAGIGSLSLDPTYEAKCLPFLQPGDLLWIVAHRDTE